jgi:hypothetical protein
MSARRWIPRMAAVFGVLLVALTWMGDPVRADILLPNQKLLNYCFEVTGMDAYPDDVFLAYFSRATGGHATIDTGKCVSFYKLAVPMIYAMPKTAFAANPPPTDRQAEQTYFMTNPNLLRSDIAIHHPGNVDKSDPVDDVVDVFHVAGLDDKKLNVVPESVRYTFTDGKKETVPWTSGDRPAPSRSNSGSSPTVAAPTAAPTAVATVRSTVSSTASSTTSAAVSTPVSATSSAGGGNGTAVVASAGDNSSKRTWILLAAGITAAAVLGIVGMIVWQERQRAPLPKKPGE